MPTETATQLQLRGQHCLVRASGMETWRYLSKLPRYRFPVVQPNMHVCIILHNTHQSFQTCGVQLTLCNQNRTLKYIIEIVFGPEILGLTVSTSVNIVMRQ